MLMAHSVEGRFPYLDNDVIDLANSLPASYKLHVLDEKHVLKRAAENLVPEQILRRAKQPYRSPDALSFVGPSAPEWVREAFSEGAITEAGIFDTSSVQRLWRKCSASRDIQQFSNADNMALCGVLSAQLLYSDLIKQSPSRNDNLAFATIVDRVPADETKILSYRA